MAANTLLIPRHANASATAADKRPPLFVPEGQVYFWTREWQSGEAQALADLEDGRFRVFSDGRAAAEWLRADDEEE